MIAEQEGFEGETLTDWLEAIISWRKLHGMLKPFTGGSKIMKFVNFFSLKKFPLYGKSLHNYACL